MPSITWRVLALAAALLPYVTSFLPPTNQLPTRLSHASATTAAAPASRRSARFLSKPPSGDKGIVNLAADTTYQPKGWDRPMYRAPDEILFEWQELMCCLRFMEEKEVNAALLAPETRQMMIAYAETVMAKGAPVTTYDELRRSVLGRWKLAFTTEDRYRALPPGTKIYYDIHKDGRLKYTLKFNDKIWDSLVSTAKFELSNQGRLFFEFDSNCIKINNPFDNKKSFNLPLPSNVGNLGSTFSDISYIDGTLWIEKLRDPATGAIYHTVFEYQGPCDVEGGEERGGREGQQAAEAAAPPSSSQTEHMRSSGSSTVRQ